MKTKRSALAAALLLAAALGCAAGASGGPSGPGSRDQITREELADLNVDDVMSAVSLLRPRWLRFRPMRTPGSPEPVVGVVIDGQPRGSIADLEMMSIWNVELVRFMTAADATIRYGTGYTGGAIVVTTRGSGG